MAEEHTHATEKPAAATVDPETFKKFVKKTVGKEIHAVLASLAEEGAMIGKKHIIKTVSKIVKKITVGDNGAFSMTDRSREKIRAFTKTYLIHTLAKLSKTHS